ncbi:hypothetical protein Mia14_0988 [Candidatus Mancarchaeum acidiphilum]|uniref:Uncharacterized protein n=1 Tax=Candidatus Mancarchaeum acidiphilum TaxID=1920749 RepID=A0A218NP99_9ARCH|nr:hypothetical protein [Candidatus Mancarchaeum acidiphilum]ASI14256.1 hypothetical protein Mia14_0988 [Candidatus Mancarchaeum acidiphilum]
MLLDLQIFNKIMPKLADETPIVITWIYNTIKTLVPSNKISPLLLILEEPYVYSYTSIEEIKPAFPKPKDPTRTKSKNKIKVIKFGLITKTNFYPLNNKIQAHKEVPKLKDQIPKLFEKNFILYFKRKQNKHDVYYIYFNLKSLEKGKGSNNYIDTILSYFKSKELKKVLDISNDQLEKIKTALAQKVTS